MKPKNCLLLNPYTRTLKPITLTMNQETLFAILGTEKLATFEVPGTGAICTYSEDIFNRLTGRIIGAKFKGWNRPYFGILIFSNLTEATKTEILAAFKTAQIRGFRFSS